MKNIVLIAIVLVIVSSIFTGCVKIPADTTSATRAGTATPTVVQTTNNTSTMHEPEAYKVFVDDSYGFFKVLNKNRPDKPVNYENLTLNISAGDEVLWINDADYKITIVSEQGLWDINDPRAILINRGFNYTFNQPGVYSFYIKEYRRIAHQRIIVNP